jgi:glycosyltransferase involved in cell wall biosynthesis
MKTEALISVIIPTYNRAGIISQTIDNVLSQSYKNIELIVVDDGSTDDTQSVLRGYGSRIRTVTQSNSGPACARNRGLEVATGEFIAFQDSDDLWKPDKLERQIALLNHFGNSVPVCLCSAVYRIVSGRPYTSFDIAYLHPPMREGVWLNVAEFLATGFVLFNQTSLIRKSAVDKVGGFDESLPYLEDYDLPLRLALEGPWALIDEHLVIYRENSANSFAAKAHQNAFVLKGCEIAILEKASKSALERGLNAVHRRAEARLKCIRRLLLYSQLENEKRFTSRVTGSLLTSVELYRQKIMRRSPFYPHPAMTLTLDDATIRLQEDALAG